jgi:D-lactate dehydrogenase
MAMAELPMQTCACAGMAGDRGMRYPELTAGALQHLETSGCSDGYSTSRTCEMSLSNHSGINFRGLVYLIDEVCHHQLRSVLNLTAPWLSWSAIHFLGRLW